MYKWSACNAKWLKERRKWLKERRTFSNSKRDCEEWEVVDLAGSGS